jgi:MFS family permease
VPLYGASIGLSASKIGLVLGAFSAATFVVRLALPIITRKLAEWTMVLAAMAAATLVYLVYPLFPTLSGMLVLSFVLGLGLGVGQPMIMVVLHRVAPPNRIGEAAGLRSTLINGTQTFLPTTFGAFGGIFGLSAIFWGMAALIGAGACYAGRGLYAEGRLGRETRAAKGDSMRGESNPHEADKH